MRPVKSNRIQPKRSSDNSIGRVRSVWGFSFKNKQSLPFLSFFTKRTPRRKREYSLLKGRLYGAVGIVFLGVIGILYVFDYPQHWYQQFMGAVLEVTQKIGFQVSDISVVGRQHAASKDILDKVNLTYKDPIFKYSPSEIRDNIRQVPWVKDAQVQRRLPNTLYIKIQERIPLAIWQHNQKHVLVDDQGVTIPGENLKNYKHLPIVVGVNAPLHISKILSILVKIPEIQSRVTALVWVGGRRWNLQLDKRIDVKLPEENIEDALACLKKVLGQDKINFKEVKSIDLRLPNQTTLRLSGAAEMHLLGKGIDA